MREKVDRRTGGEYDTYVGDFASLVDNRGLSNEIMLYLHTWNLIR